MKAKLLMSQMENGVYSCVLDSVQQGNAIIIDAMSVLQTLKPMPQTFGELSSAVLHRVVAKEKHYQSVRTDTRLWTDTRIFQPKTWKEIREVKVAFKKDQKVPVQL